MDEIMGIKGNLFYSVVYIGIIIKDSLLACYNYYDRSKRLCQNNKQQSELDSYNEGEALWQK